MLSPVDGRLQVLNQGHTGYLALGLYAAALPVHISLPAISAISAVVSGLSEAVDELSPPTGDHPSPAPGAVHAQQGAQGEQSHGSQGGFGGGNGGQASLQNPPLPAAAAALGAAHVYIEDAKGSLLGGDMHQQASGAADQMQRVRLSDTALGSSEGAGPRQQQSQQQQGQQQHLRLDDLRGGMFTALVGDPADPGPLQIKVGVAGEPIPRLGPIHLSGRHDLCLGYLAAVPGFWHALLATT
jgi:hypothetical protein